MSLSNKRSILLKWLLLSLALFSYVLIVNSQAAAYDSADTGYALTTSQGNACPDSGVWPPGCVPGGSSSTDNGNTAGGNACPDSGVWPPGCVPGGSSNTDDSNAGGGNACPDSGAWPPGCTPGGSGNADDSNSDGGNVCPDSGAWPPGCTPKGNDQTTTEPSSESTTTPTVTEGPSNARLNALIDQAIIDLNIYWNAELDKQNVNYRKPKRVTRYEGNPEESPNAFYIPGLHYIAMDMRLLREVATSYGEYAAVSVLAHEWGHMIQDQADIFDRDVYNALFELQADCMTGSFIKTLYANGILTDGNIDQIGNLFFSIGDDQLTDREIPLTHPGAHGSGEQRRTAFHNGFDTDANNCIHGYQ